MLMHGNAGDKGKGSRIALGVYLRSNDNESMGSNLLEKLRVEIVVKKVTMEENK